MGELIIEYILHRLSLKGSMVVCFDGRKMYHEDVISHITRAFNIDWFMANGYLAFCVFELDDDFSYGHWTLLTKPPEPSRFMDAGYVYAPYIPIMIAEDDFNPRRGIRDRYFAGLDPAMGDDATVMNFLVRERMGVQFNQQVIPPIVDLPIL